MHRAARRAVVLLAALGGLACSDALAPEDVAGTFVLRRVGDQPLPALLFVNEFGASTVHADTLRLRGDGRGTRSGASEMAYAAGGGSGRRSGTVDFTFGTADGRIAITFYCPPNANCTPGPHLIARRRGDALVVDEAPHSLQRLPLIYERLPGGS